MANSWMDQILNYENSGAIRNKPVSPELETAIRNGVLAVYGDGYTVDIISGGQDAGRTTGSRRHTTKGAADVYIKDPRGNTLTGDKLIPIAQHWQTHKIGGVGFPAKASQSLHLDLIGGSGPGAIPLQAGEGMLWYYGTPTAEQRRQLTSGAAPKYALSYEQITKGLLPPESLKGVGTELSTVDDLTLKTGAPIPKHPAIAERARAEVAARAPQPAPLSESVKARRRAELSNGFSHAGTEGVGQFTLKADERKPVPVGQSQIERTVAKTPLQSIPQSQMERVSSTKTLNTKSIPQSVIERNQPKPGQSTIERNAPKAPGPKATSLGTLTPTNTPGVSRINGGNQAGQVAMPRDVRPNVTIPDLSQIAETLPGGSNEKKIPGFSYAGTETSKATKKAPAKLSTPLAADQLSTTIERVKPSDLTLRVAATAPPVTAAVTTQQNTAKKTRSAAATAALVEQEVIQTAKPAATAGKPAAGKVKTNDPMSAVMDALGFTDMAKGMGDLFSGIDDFFSGITGPNRSPLSQSQIDGANRNSQNHNPAALAAINRGERSYTSSGGAVTPTTAMNGNVRNTYGDSDSGNGSISSM